MQMWTLSLYLLIHTCKCKNYHAPNLFSLLEKELITVTELTTEYCDSHFDFLCFLLHISIIIATKPINTACEVLGNPDPAKSVLQKHI